VPVLEDDDVDPAALLGAHDGAAPPGVDLLDDEPEVASWGVETGLPARRQSPARTSRP
jgi:hypothetical protein